MAHLFDKAKAAPGGRVRGETVVLRSGRRGDAAYEALCSAIRNQKVKAGERITEEDLSTSFGVSRTPIREALHRLQARGLVEQTGKGGFAVVELGRQQVLELYALREILEGAAARFAANHAHAGEIAMMTRLNEEFLDRNVDAAVQVNRDFHRAIYEAGHNRYLSQALDELMDTLGLLPGTTLAQPDRVRSAYREHCALIAAIQARNPAEAERIAREHVAMAQEIRITLTLRDI